MILSTVQWAQLTLRMKSWVTFEIAGLRRDIDGSCLPSRRERFLRHSWNAYLSFPAEEGKKVLHHTIFLRTLCPTFSKIQTQATLHFFGCDIQHHRKSRMLHYFFFWDTDLGFFRSDTPTNLLGLRPLFIGVVTSHIYEKCQTRTRLVCSIIPNWCDTQFFFYRV